MAMIGAAFGIGFTFGPLIGAASLWIAPTHYGVIGFVAAGLLLSAFAVRETRHHVADAQQGRGI